jgi:cell division septum initiation protein DivIVA
MPDQSSAATEHAILAEITRPLEALPDDPLALVDADFATALRGYDRVAVDEYVRQTRRLVAELQATRSPEAAVRRALERVGEQISGILQRAHETAEQITAQSRTEAEDRLQQARVEAAQIADAAEQRVRDLDADTDRIWLERERIVADAEDLAGQLVTLAKTAAERFSPDAEEPTTGAVAVEPDAEAEGEELDGEEVEALDAEEVEAPEAEKVEAPEPETELLRDDGPSEPEDRSEIERTVAFQPLEEDPGPTAAQSGAADDDAPAERGATDDDDTAVIPPASQAANRRLDK